ncbi:MAG TPA: hypothetical protein VGV34_01385 [Solirubrobacterales bacterium]|nr:hypothetical protein [Solirubrobacterales bacterium]
MRTFPAVQGELLLPLLLHLVLTALPMAAAALGAAKLGVRRLPLLLAIGMAAGGVAAIVAFWVYYWDRLAGESFSYFVAFGSAAWIVWSLIAGGLDRRLLRGLAVPFGLWALGSAFLVFFGFLHAGLVEPLGVGGTRFSDPLPTDNGIPFFYADWFFDHGYRGDPPLFGDWLSSDRPPLQIGYVLAQRPFGWDETGLHYQVLGVVLQQLWIVGAWALLLAGRVGRLTRALTMIVLLLSSLAILNGFFVWPKMLPAAMLLAAAAMVLTPLWGELRGKLWAGALFAALCALAMLGHGASVFGVIPLLVIAALRGMPSWRWLGVAAMVGIVLMAPWSAYQKYGDPPGNRLLKWTLAGVVDPKDDRGTFEAISDTYGEAGFERALHWKGQNFVMMVGGKSAYESMKSALESGSLTKIVKATRAVLFFNLIPSLGLLLLAPLAMAFAWRRGSPDPDEWRFALVCLGAFLVGAVAWGLLVIGSKAYLTSIHIGSYLVPILGICGCAVGLRAALPRFAVPYLGFAALLSLALYVPVYDPLPGSRFSVANALLAAAGLAGFVLLAVHQPDRRREAEAEEDHSEQGRNVGERVLG